MRLPILQLKGILVTSIQVDLADEDALQFQDDILRMVQKTEAKGLLIDITALEVVDSFLSRMINETAQMVKLLGTEVVVCGMRPDVSLALTEMGRGLIGVEAALNLDHGMGKIAELIESHAPVAAAEPGVRQK